MVRRRSTVRFRNGAQVDDLIRKDSNGSWVPVGTNGCHQGTESPATASPDRPYPQGIWRYPEQPVRSRIPSQPADHSAGQARTGTGAVGPRDCLDAPCDNSPGRAPEPRDGDSQARSAPAWCRDHVSGPGAADGSSRAGPSPRRSSAGQPGLFMPTRRRGLRPVRRPVSRQLGTRPIAIYVTSAMAATGVGQSRRAAPSRAGSAGVILRGWELITRPGCHQGPGQCERCRSR